MGLFLGRTLSTLWLIPLALFSFLGLDRLTLKPVPLVEVTHSKLALLQMSVLRIVGSADVGSAAASRQQTTAPADQSASDA